MRIANVIAEVEPNKPFWILVTNFAEPGQLLQKMLIDTASNIPIELTEIPTKMGREFAKCLKLFN